MGRHTATLLPLGGSFGMRAPPLTICKIPPSTYGARRFHERFLPRLVPQCDKYFNETFPTLMD